MHSCLFYSQSNELWEHCQRQIALADKTTRWVYIADEHPAEVVQNQLQSNKFGEVIESEATLFRSSPIRIPELISNLTAIIQQNLNKAGHLLLFVEMSWALRQPSGAVYLREYEAEIERLTETFPLTVVCLYNQQIMLDRQLMIGIQTHRHLIGDAGLIRNPHYVPPEIFVKRDLRGQFENWLHQLVPSAVSTNGTSIKVNEHHNLETEAKLVAQTEEEGRWKIRCFGGLRVYRADGSAIQWDVVSGATRKTKTLFAFLLFRGERGATAEEISDLLWPDAIDQKQSLNRLYHTIRCLRKALSPNLKNCRKSPFVLRKDQHYYLALPPNSWLDLPMFQELCYRGNALLRQKNWHEALICQASAKRLYTGKLLADIPDKYANNRDIDWCWSQRYWYQEMFVKLTVDSAEAHHHLHHFSDALSACDQALHIDPVNERAHQMKIRILASVNRTDAVKRQYRLYTNALKQFNLGVPTPEFEQFWQSVQI